MYKNSLLQNILDPTGRRLHPVWCGCSLSWHWCPPPPSSWPPRPFQQLVYQKGREVGVNLILWEMESFSLEVRDLSRMGPPTKWQRFETSTVGKGKDFKAHLGKDWTVFVITAVWYSHLIYDMLAMDHISITGIVAFGLKRYRIESFLSSKAQKT